MDVECNETDDPVTAYAPAYAMGECGVTGSGPQCSGFPDEFCYFCRCEKDVDTANGPTADLYGSLTGLIHTMTETNKEFVHIVGRVHFAYETQIRPILNSTGRDDDGDDDEVLLAAKSMLSTKKAVPFLYPPWSRESIARHITFSNQFRPVFKAGVTQIFHSIIGGHNRKMFDANTKEVIESERSALMSTLNMFMKWEKFNNSSVNTNNSSSIM